MDKKREEMNEDEIQEDNRRLAREANEARNQDRLKRLNDIANQSDEIKSEVDEIEDIEDEQWAEDGKAKEPEEGESDQEKELDEARAAGADDVRITNGETYYRLVVNGAEKWMTLAELRATSSKVASADQYLRDAKVAATKAISSPPSGKDEVERPAKGRARDMLSRAIMGEQEAIDELAQLIEKPSDVTSDVLQAVDERVDGRLTFRGAVDWFEGEYAEERKVPLILRFIVERDTELARSDPGMDFKERLKKVGDEARAQLRDLRKTLGAPQKTTEDKQQRKASLRTPQPAAGRQVESPDDDEGEDTYAQSIVKMAQARNQARPIIHSKR